MAIDKHQCIARLDKIELEKLDVIRADKGLSRSGAIRRLIRDFNIESENVSSASKFIVDRQISKNIFLQLPSKELGNGFIQPNFPGVHYNIWFYQEWLSEASIVGYVICSGIEGLEDYKYSLLYLLDGLLCRQDCISGEEFGKSSDCGLSESADHLQQIFVV
jgi:hypothetical protein